MRHAVPDGDRYAQNGGNHRDDIDDMAKRSGQGLAKERRQSRPDGQRGTARIAEKGKGKPESAEQAQAENPKCRNDYLKAGRTLS